MTCPECGHPATPTRTVRGLLDALRKKPAHNECAYLDEDDIGNGMAGGNSYCMCRSAAHSEEALRPA